VVPESRGEQIEVAELAEAGGFQIDDGKELGEIMDLWVLVNPLCLVRA
jgi:hypothetical protein